jgi:FixJ family two-component response regulator
MQERPDDLVSIVDDDQAICQATSSLLRANGLRTESFSSAEEFLNSSHANDTGCIILDLRMPGTSGLELQRRLAEADRPIPVIFITAYGTPETREEALQAGAVDFLAKPFSEEALLNATRRALGNIQYKQKILLAEHFLAGLRDRNWDIFRSIMSEDVVWNLPGNSVISGEACGVEAVIRRAQSIVSYGPTFTLKHILIGQHSVALSLHLTARRREVGLDVHLAIVFNLRGEKISAGNTYLSDVGVVDAFYIAL